MDFFQQQDQARRNARLLLWSFLAAVLGLVILANLAVAAFLWFSQDYNVYSGSRQGMAGFLGYLSWERFGMIGLAICAVVALVVLTKWLSLSTGGKTVAEGMGGRRILPQTGDPDERRCLNVVEELALAATMPVPATYVLDDERGINAFAAGQTPADAVVGVTRGTLRTLKRHELEGVIAHEFSHILNGDMRLNIRLAAMLKGITFIGDSGYLLMHAGRGSHRSMASGDSGGGRGGAGLPMLGLALWVLGLLGAMAAGFIKAAIGRQKEYLADASAVQFTRNPDTIGDALKVIGGFIPGTLVHAARAAEMSHIFFGEIRHRIWDSFATHPPLAERIRRVDPRWDGRYIERKPVQYGQDPGAGPGVGRAGIAMAAMAAGMAAAADSGAESSPTAEALPDAQFAQAGIPGPTPEEQRTADCAELPAVLVGHSHEPAGASALVFCLMLAPSAEVRREQASIIENSTIPGVPLLAHNLAPAVAELSPPQRLPLLELCLPALKVMSYQQYRCFKDTLLLLIRADRQVDLHEWCLFQLTRHYLDPEFVRVNTSRPRYNRLEKVLFHLRMVLSTLAWHGSGEAGAAFRLGADALGFSELEMLPEDQCGVEAFGNAVNTLADCYPLLKPTILKAMAMAAAADGHLNASEREIIASTAAVMDCPVGELLGPAGPQPG